VLATASKFLGSVFSSNCDCATFQSTTFDLVCPAFESVAVEKVLELIAGRNVIIDSGDFTLYKEMQTILETFQIRADLPPMVATECHSYTEITIDDDEEELLEPITEPATNLEDAVEHFLNEEDLSDNEVNPTTTSAGSHVCHYCDKKFDSSASLDKHVGSHFKARSSISAENGESKENNFNCELCNKSFSLKFSFDQHMKKHSTTNESESNVEGEKGSATTFQNPEKVKSEIDVEERLQKSDSASHICQICGKHFQFKIALEAHIKKHATIENVATANRRSSFDEANHKMTTEGESEQSKSTTEEITNPIQVPNKRRSSSVMYKCHVCKCQMNIYSNLMAHMGSLHYRKELKELFNIEQPLSCSLCPYVGKTETVLYSHLSIRHKGLSSLIPSKEASTVTSVNPNSATESASLEEKSDEVDEIVNVGKLFKCPMCDIKISKSVALLKHLALEHYKERLMTMYDNTGTNWQCRECKETFTEEDSLIDHLINTHKALKRVILFNKTGEIKPPGDSQEKEETETALKPETSDNGNKILFKCPKCPIQMQSHNLLKHISFKHYKEMFQSMCGQKKGECGLCKQVFTSEQKLFLHLATVHDTLKDILPPEILAQNSPSKRRAKSLDNLREEKIQKMETTNTMMIMSDDNDQASSSQSSDEEKCLFNCHICKTQFPDFEKLLSHYAQTHYRMKLMQAYGNAENRCIFCKDFPSGNQKLLLDHWAQKHSLLQKHLPQKISNDTEKADEPENVSKGKKAEAIKKKKKPRCKLCGKNFGSETTLKVHVRLCAKELDREIEREVIKS